MAESTHHASNSNPPEWAFALVSNGRVHDCGCTPGQPSRNGPGQMHTNPSRLAEIGYCLASWLVTASCRTQCTPILPLHGPRTRARKYRVGVVPLSLSFRPASVPGGRQIRLPVFSLRSRKRPRAPGRRGPREQSSACRGPRGAGRPGPPRCAWARRRCGCPRARRRAPFA
jgi:hypothetical protein